MFPNFVKPGMHPRTVHSKLPNVIFDEHLFISSWVVTYRQTDAEKLNGIFLQLLVVNSLWRKNAFTATQTKMLISSTWASHMKMRYNSLLLATQRCIKRKRPAIHTKNHKTKNICKYYFQKRFVYMFNTNTTGPLQEMMMYLEMYLHYWEKMASN